MKPPTYATHLLLLCLPWNSKHFLRNVFQQNIILHNNGKIIQHIEAETNGRHFAGDIYKCIFLNENVWIPIKISLKFVP